MTQRERQALYKKVMKALNERSKVYHPRSVKEQQEFIKRNEPTDEFLLQLYMHNKLNSAISKVDKQLAELNKLIKKNKKAH